MNRRKTLTTTARAAAVVAAVAIIMPTSSDAAVKSQRFTCRTQRGVTYAADVRYSVGGTSPVTVTVNQVHSVFWASNVTIQELSILNQQGRLYTYVKHDRYNSQPTPPLVKKYNWRLRIMLAWHPPGGDQKHPPTWTTNYCIATVNTGWLR